VRRCDDVSRLPSCGCHLYINSRVRCTLPSLYTPSDFTILDNTSRSPNGLHDTSTMSHLVPPQEEKRDATQWAGKLPVDHEVPPQYTAPGVAALKNGDFKVDKDVDFLVAPQEEKITTSRAGNAPLDRGLDRLEKEIDKHGVADDSTNDERARDRQISSSVLAGAAGVTGEDLSTTENKHVV